MDDLGNIQLTRRDTLTLAALLGMQATGVPAFATTQAPSYDINAPSWYDMRPVVKAIMELENWVLRDLPADKPLVVLVSEEHFTLSHKMLLHALLIAHFEQAVTSPDKSFAFGYELPHDFFGRYRDPANQTFSPVDLLHSLPNRLLFTDSMSKMFQYCVDNKIPVRFNDIARAEGPLRTPILDQTDPFTRELVTYAAPELLGKDIFRDPGDSRSARQNYMGFKLSDVAMFLKATAHMQETGCKIYIQHCGAGHIFGVDQLGGYQYSLTARFREGGYTVLPVVPSYEHLRKYLPRRVRRDQQFAKIRGLDFNTEPSPQRRLRTAIDTEERKWNRINRASGYMFTGGVAPK